MALARALRFALAASAILVWVGLATPVAACSCVAFTGFDAVADSEHLVVAGVAERRLEGALTIAVDHWLWGPAPVARLVVSEPSEQDMCSMGPNARLGDRWLWVAWIGDARPVINQCQPSWSLSDADGQAQLGQAIARFGGVRIPAVPPGTPDPPPSGDATLWLVLSGAGLLGLGVFGLAVAFGARQGRAG